MPTGTACVLALDRGLWRPGPVSRRRRRRDTPRMWADERHGARIRNCIHAQRAAPGRTAAAQHGTHRAETEPGRTRRAVLGRVCCEQRRGERICARHTYWRVARIAARSQRYRRRLVDQGQAARAWPALGRNRTAHARGRGQGTSRCAPRGGSRVVCRGCAVARESRLSRHIQHGLGRAHSRIRCLCRPPRCQGTVVHLCPVSTGRCAAVRRYSPVRHTVPGRATRVGQGKAPRVYGERAQHRYRCD